MNAGDNPDRLVLWVPPVLSPDFDAYAEGRISASQVRCLMCQQAPCGSPRPCPKFGSPEYLQRLNEIHGKAAQPIELSAELSPEAEQIVAAVAAREGELDAYEADPFMAGSEAAAAYYWSNGGEYPGAGAHDADGSDAGAVTR